VAIGIYLAEHGYYPTFRDGTINCTLRYDLHDFQMAEISLDGMAIVITESIPGERKERARLELANPDSFPDMLKWLHKIWEDYIPIDKMVKQILNEPVDILRVVEKIIGRL